MVLNSFYVYMSKNMSSYSIIVEKTFLSTVKYVGTFVKKAVDPYEVSYIPWLYRSILMLKRQLADPESLSGLLPRAGLGDKGGVWGGLPKPQFPHSELS